MDERPEEPAGFDLTVDWPAGDQLEPLRPAPRRPGPWSSPEASPQPSATEDEPGVQSDDDDDERAAEVAMAPGLWSALGELSARFDSLASTGAVLERAIGLHLRDYAAEIAELESTITGHIEEYREGHGAMLRAITDLLPDRGTISGLASRSVDDMRAAADDAARSVESSARQGRLMIAAGEDALQRMTASVRWLGERLLGHVGELDGHLAASRLGSSPDPDGGPSSAESVTLALAECRQNVKRSLDRLAATRPTEPADDLELAGRSALQGLTERRLHAGLEQLTREVRELAHGGPADGGGFPLAELATQLERLEARVDRAVERISEEVYDLGGSPGEQSPDLGPRIEALERRLISTLIDVGEEIARRQADLADPGLRTELSRIADEVKALRRRTALRGKTVAVLGEDQIEQIAGAVSDVVRAAERRRAVPPSRDRAAPEPVDGGPSASRAPRPLQRGKDARADRRPPRDR